MATPRRILGEIDANRGYNNELSTQLRAKIVGAYEDGVPLGRMAKTSNLSKATLQKTVDKVCMRTENTSQPRSGRPVTYTNRECHQLLRLVRLHPKWTYGTLLREMDTNLSKRTIQRIPEIEGIAKWRAVKRPLLSTEHATKRLAFATKYKDLDETD